ncbi:hypothetical protein H5410_023389 [Solanum commersonii]|uniref:Yippee domain-containing protein n=1 Tax=Solanum commersonii TaxID=4109 RepID=A0A9J5ZJI8_SOLCO|nr:hypothetical protein H5410_023389 [Solanum commersonii]
MDGHCPLPGDIVVDILSRLPVCISNVCASSTGFLSSKVRVSKRSIFIRRTIVPISSFKVAMAQHFFLFGEVGVNVTVGAKEEWLMMTGMRTVVDIFCVGCGSIESAHDKTQKYKEGKFILERFKVAGPDGSVYIVSHDDELGGDDEP